MSSSHPFTVLIPAHYASQRLPGKVLMDIKGKPMLQHVYERCLKSGADKVWITTCDKNIQRAALDFGAAVQMTSDHHKSGTERIIEAVIAMDLADDAVVVNVQGDEPNIPAKLITQVAALTPKEGMATMATPIPLDECHDPNLVKVVCDCNSYALYFSRAFIPYRRENLDTTLDSNGDANNIDNSVPHHYLRHIGIYAYRVHLLKRWQKWLPCALEKLERLEQLRPLFYGVPIKVGVVDQPPPAGVDTSDDLQRVRNL